jgi:dienelactone hydrolase
MYFNIACMMSIMLAACGVPALPSPTPFQPSPPIAVINPPTLPPPQVLTTSGPETSTITLPSKPEPTATATVTFTPDPYAGLTIADLESRSYGGGDLKEGETLAVNSYFTRSLFTYPSDGLTIYGFMDVPVRASPPFPVIIALHGYIDPGIYATIDYTTRYADALARAGFLVLHPNLRNFPPSDAGTDLFRVGMAVDVLNLIALVKGQAGKHGPLEMANPQEIGLWGHSMGGGITTRVITISPDVRAAVLYSAMSGDEQKNYERIFHYFSNGTRGQAELDFPPQAFQLISPVYFFDHIQAAVSIHYGESDPDVPPAWSKDTCLRLRDLGKSVECYSYPGEPHTFHGEGDQLFMQRMIDFYNRWLR